MPPAIDGRLLALLALLVAVAAAAIVYHVQAPVDRGDHYNEHYNSTGNVSEPDTGNTSHGIQGTPEASYSGGEASNATSTGDLKSSEGSSGGAGRYGIVEIHVNGTMVDGVSITASFTYPGVSSSEFFSADTLPAVFIFNISRELAEAERIHDELMEKLAGTGGGSGRDSQFLPTLTLIVYIEEDGVEERYRVVYDSLSYYRVQGVDAALGSYDPFEPFRKGVTIYLDLDRLAGLGENVVRYETLRG